MTKPFKRIVVTGASGFLGSHIVPQLTRSGDKVITVSRTDCDLLEKASIIEMLLATRPDCVVHLAAKVGGIIANDRYPADFYYENLMMNTLLFDLSYRHGVKKFLTLIGGCSYPSEAISPIDEEQMWNGYPQQESAPYSTAKKMVIVQSMAYRKQHGFNSVVLIPGNVYGEFDNFDEEYSHVIPALIRRFEDAKTRNLESVTCYGSGRPTRDFVYAGDVAELIPWFLDKYNSSEPVNISSGKSVSIKQLSETVADTVGFKGKIQWDTSKPDGQIDKIFDVTRLNGLGLSCDTSLQTGLRKTVDWYRNALKSGDARI
ncbi:MAG: GDP-L-fucose synthase [Lentisphaerae bacterium]|jgi:GDP-L-fucose synthase|nr:GDP-L-fucose synthase [Lentisphaerota bacterium]